MTGSSWPEWHRVVLTAKEGGEAATLVTLVEGFSCDDVIDEIRVGARRLQRRLGVHLELTDCERLSVPADLLEAHQPSNGALLWRTVIDDKHLVDDIDAGSALTSLLMNIGRQNAVPRLEDGRFWSLISRAGGRDDRVERIVSALDARDARSFEETLAYKLHCLELPDFVEAAREEIGGLSDDVFLYLRCGVILGGREVFAQAQRSPKELAWGALELDGERLLYVASMAYEERTGNPFEYTASWPRSSPHSRPPYIDATFTTALRLRNGSIELQMRVWNISSRSMDEARSSNNELMLEYSRQNESQVIGIVAEYDGDYAPSGDYSIGALRGVLAGAF